MQQGIRAWAKNVHQSVLFSARSTLNIFFIAFEFMAIIQLCEKVGREK